MQIASGDYDIGIAPQDGGGLVHLRFRGVDVLRPATEPQSGPLGLSCFPLVPYANRIGDGRFVWDGRTVSLPPNLEGEPYPLHGDGWRTPWNVAEASNDRLVLEMRHAPGDWPWAYSARLTSDIDDRGVGFTLEVANLGERAMPAGLGFHPYFPGRASARLQASVAGVWLTDAKMLPTRLAAPDRFGDWSAGAPLARPELIDNCHVGWSGPADIQLADRGLSVRMTAGANLRFLQIYSPPGEDFFCVEPVSHRPDALNAPDPLAEGIVALEPGEAAEATMRIEASPL